MSGINESIFKRTASQSLAHAALQAPPENAAPTVYTNGSHQGPYASTVSASPGAGMAASSQAYADVPVDTAYAYSNGTPSSLPQQSTGGFEPQPYGTGLESAMAPSHAAALQAAAASTAATQRAADAYAYSNAQAVSNGHQPPYAATSVTPHEWHHFTKTYMQQVAPQGEYLNTATTLMALGGREGGGTQGLGVETTGAIENPVIPGSGTIPLQWPKVLYSNGHMGP